MVSGNRTRLTCTFTTTLLELVRMGQAPCAKEGGCNCEPWQALAICHNRCLAASLFHAFLCIWRR